MKNIAFIGGVFPGGGIDAITIQISDYLSKQGFSIYLFASGLRDNFKKSDLKSVRIEILPDADIESMVNGRWVVDQVNRLKIDCLIIPFYKVAWMDDVRQQTDSKVVFSNHGSPLWENYVSYSHSKMLVEQSGSLAKLAEWYLLRVPIYALSKKYKRRAIRQNMNVYNSCDCYTVLCEEYRRDMESYLGVDRSKSKFHVLTNPSPNVEYCTESKKQNEVLYVGRLSRSDKRVDRLIDIWSGVENDFPDWTLKIVGDGDDRIALEDRVNELGLRNVHFCGYASNVREYYQTASILCLTSDFEGWGLVLVEAQMAGVIPIAFGSTAGIREILGECGQYGFCIKPFDKKEYGRKLRLLMRDSDLRKSMMPQIKKGAERYSIENTGQQWLEMFNMLDATR